MSRYTEEHDEITFTEPILAQKAVRCEVQFAAKSEWEVKQKAGWTAEQMMTMVPYLGKKYDVCKLTINIVDESVRTEHDNAKPKTTIEDQFNIEQYPYPDKESGQLKKMGKQKLYELEAALGFDPVFTVGGKPVEAFVTKNGNKVAPKIDGVKRGVNPAFFDAYFTSDGTPVVDNWVGKTIYCDIGVEKSEKFGTKNVVARYLKAPVI